MCAERAVKAPHGLSPIHARALELVADGLESGALAENFSMRFVRADLDVKLIPKNQITEPIRCGTVCCIHGWTMILLDRVGVPYTYPWDVSVEYERLYVGRWSERGLDETDAKKAAKAIRYFLRTGKCPRPKEIEE